MKFNEGLEQIEREIEVASTAECVELVGKLERLKALVWGRIMAASLPTPNDSNLLTIPEVASQLKVSEYRAYELVRHGEIKKTSIGKTSVRVKPSDLAAYVAQQRS